MCGRGTRSERERIPARRSGGNPFEKPGIRSREAPGIARLFERAQGRGRSASRAPPTASNRIITSAPDWHTAGDSRPPNAMRLLKPVLSKSACTRFAIAVSGETQTSRRVCSAGRAGCPDTSAAHGKAKGASNANARANARRHMCRRAHGAGGLLAGSRRVHGPSSFGTVRFLGPRRQSLVPAAARHDATSTAESRTARQLATSSPSPTGRKTIDGATCVVVNDRLYLAGKLAERTTDWYTQDDAGNVWYFGEATAELDAYGRVTSTRGSWQAGRRRREPGIYMPAHPGVGPPGPPGVPQGPRRGSLPGARACTPRHGPYEVVAHALLTKEWTPLEPGVRRPQALPSGHRHGPRADREGGRERLGARSPFATTVRRSRPAARIKCLRSREAFRRAGSPRRKSATGTDPAAHAPYKRRSHP